eukprot:scaffold10270_cov125-Cylindrotheca_fusiformis.AAC.3
MTSSVDEIDVRNYPPEVQLVELLLYTTYILPKLSSPTIGELFRDDERGMAKRIHTTCLVL